MKCALLILLLLVAACGGGGTEPAPLVAGYRDLGQLEDAVQAATDRLDSDGDSIPDSIERELGTDPDNPDSDFDGLVDNYELFPPGYRREDPLPDADSDRMLASLDNDEDNDRVNDGWVTDTDGDEVPNFLEYYGYTYDFLTGEFVLWDGNPDTPHYFTDPLQSSTDQDAYPDGMEASGALLDPTVRAPGDDPLVPAYPNIVFELTGYEVTLNEDIQITTSESLSKGRSWSRETSTSYSSTNESSWSLGAKMGYEVGGTDVAKTTGEVSATVGQTYSNSHTTSFSVGQGESITDERGWSRARSTNPTDAARIKLHVRVRNRGTAPLSNMVPTLTLRIGGMNVATFEPGNAQVNMLVPGAVFPEEDGVYWVIDSTTGGGPLSLTMSELRALERGAPVSISLTQVKGDAMRLSPDGVWVSIGDANQYSARCEAVCANIRVEFADGEIVHQLVYADDHASSPVMSLGDALRLIGVDNEGAITYRNRDGTVRVRSLDGFHYGLDPETLRRNGWTLELDGDAETAPPSDTALAAMRLYPDSHLVIREPRDPAANPRPFIHFSYLDPQTGEILATVSDYAGIQSVSVISEAKNRIIPLMQEIPGSGLYGGQASPDDGFDDSDQLKLVVTNIAGESEETDLGRLYVEPDPVAPVITNLEYSELTGRLYAQVKSGNPDHPSSDIAWIRAFHPDIDGGVVDLAPVVDYFRDPDGYFVDLGAGFSATGLELVAYVEPGVYTLEVLRDETVEKPQVHAIGTLTVDIFTTVTSGGLWRWNAVGVNLDKDGGGLLVEKTNITVAFVAPDPPALPADFWVRVNGPNVFNVATMGWYGEYAFMPGGNAKYRSATLQELMDAMPNSTASQAVGEQGGIKVGETYAVRTTSGRYGKIYVRAIDYDYSAFWLSQSLRMTIDYAVFK